MVADVAAKGSDADRVRYNELGVKGAKEREQFVKEAHAKGARSEAEVLTVELFRLEFEDALAKAKAKIGAEGATLKARLEVAKKVRDTMYQLFREGGNIDLERYLTWQKRYDDLAYVVTLMTGGDRVRLYEGQLAELNQLEQLQKDRFRRGEVGQIELHIVQYYRLEAEEALARAKAEAGESLGKASAQD